MLDLMTFLRNQYVTYLQELGDGEDPNTMLNETGELNILESFLEWARNYLASHNTPVNLIYDLSAGVGLKLAQGQMVCFVQNTMQRDMDNTTAVPVIGALSHSPMSQRGMLPDTSVPIFGTKDKIS